jgi:hypothetical protein
MTAQSAELQAAHADVGRRLRCPFEAPTIRCDALLLCQDEGRNRRIRVGGRDAFVPRPLVRSNRMPLWIRRFLK